MVKQPTLPVPTEHEEQARLFRWFETIEASHSVLPWIFAIPNGSHKSVATAMKFQREGLRSGVPDIFVPWGSAGCHGLFIEMKRQKGGVVSDTQKAWHTMLRERLDYRVEVCAGAVEAARVITSYLDLPLALVHLL